jgi:hypothetical protein
MQTWEDGSSDRTIMCSKFVVRKLVRVGVVPAASKKISLLRQRQAKSIDAMVESTHKIIRIKVKLELTAYCRE